MTESLAPTAVVAGYFDIWNEADPARRRALIERTWSPGAAYLDPMFAAKGADELDGMVAQVHAAYPGHHFRLDGGVDAHHGRARWGWEFAPPGGGAPVMRGVDFATLAADGRLQDVTGFFIPPSDTAGGAADGNA